MTAKECVLCTIGVCDFDRLYREAGLAVLCKDGRAVAIFEDEEQAYAEYAV